MRKLSVNVENRQIVIRFGGEHRLESPEMLSLDIETTQDLMRQLNYCLNSLGADHYKGLIPYSEKKKK